ncbi:hypothetical protein XAUC_06410 [Xanthomonas citri pv. aurantifolii str. ICPB 10535]|nr:hypothetical protein XAUC_06410 [Xanthomonas citri pv. aurantifolii str. ICPB 10535]
MVAVVVGELIIANTQGQQPSIVNLPTIFQIVRLLFDCHAGRCSEDALLCVITIRARAGDTDPEARAHRRLLVGCSTIDPLVTRTRGAYALVIGVEIHVVHTCSQVVVPQPIIQFQPQAAALIDWIISFCPIGSLIVADRRTTSNGRILARHTSQEWKVGNEGIELLVVLGAAAPGCVQGQVIGDIAGVLENVVGVLDFVGVGICACAVTTYKTVVVKACVVTASPVGVLDSSVFNDIAIVDVPIQFSVEFRRAVLVIVARLDGVTAGIGADAVNLLRFASHKDEEPIFDQGAACIGAVDSPRLLVVFAGAI